MLEIQCLNWYNVIRCNLLYQKVTVDEGFDLMNNK